ncbi:MAG TPA: DUF1761 domain-containing protein [Candidatus Paceibacterota bacterium]|nr:DUF1761 domain-containing protein [Candidatus Paceibacterota bacterium]
MVTDLNEVAVIVAAIVSVAVGSIWYSPLLFGASWLRAARLSVEEENMTSKEASLLALKGVVVEFVFFYALALLLLASEAGGMSFAGYIGVMAALLLSFLIGITVWERKPLSYVLVNGGYTVVALAVGLSIVTFWPW